MKNKWVLGAVIASLIFTACYDSKELDERSFVICIGVDEGEKEGYLVSLGIAKSGNTNNGAVSEEIRVVEGQSFPSAIRLFTSKNSQSMYFGHTQTVVLNEDILNNRQLLTDVLDTIQRNSQFAEKIIILSSKVDAQTVLKAVETDEEGDGLYIWDFYKNSNGKVQNTSPLRLKQFSKAINTDAPVVVPLIGIDDGVAIGGGTVLDKEGIKGYLTAEEMQGMLYIKENTAGHLIEVKNQQVSGTVEITKSNGRISFEENNGLLCTINIDAKGRAESIPLGTYSNLQNMFSQSIKTDVEGFLDKMQNQFGVDALGITEELEKKEPKYFEKYGKDAFKTIKFDVKINGEITSNGVIQ